MRKTNLNNKDYKIVKNIYENFQKINIYNN